MSTELATVGSVLQGVSDVQGAMVRLRGLQEAVSAIMVKGVDYGVIPGTDKPTLYKPGAEKLVEFYGLIASVTVDEQREDWERGFWHYRVTCTLTNRRTGEVLANGVGSCNSMESRYRWRVEWGNTPRTQQPAGDGWQWVHTKRGGAWKRRTENEDRWDLPNTILKMAKKRAYVDATLSVTRSSGMFTQDLEDFAPPHEDEPAPAAKSVIAFTVDATTGEVSERPPTQQQAQPSNPRLLSQEEGRRLQEKLLKVGTEMGYSAEQVGTWAQAWAQRAGRLHVIGLDTEQARRIVAEASNADMAGGQVTIG